MAATPDDHGWTPRFPTLTAVAILAAWVSVLCLPMLSGNFLGGAGSDQTWTGIAFREYWASEFHRTGAIPQWNPFMFGGMPFVAAMHGDIFYVTSFLRVFLNAAQTLNVAFWLHLVLAGVFTFVFLRVLRLSWTAAVVGGLAYQLSGIIASQVSPGHDGKLVVSALLPLLLTGLVVGVRRRRPEGFALLALVTGLDILSPHLQMSQYSLIFAGLFALWLCFLDPERPPERRRQLQSLAWATLAVALGFGLSMIQILPFVKYGPYAARVAGNQGWLYATSWSMAPADIPGWIVPTFTGTSMEGTWWGANAVKLHSEYLGAAASVLALTGMLSATRRGLVKFLAAVAVLFVLVALAGYTPFYRLWYAIVPGVKVTRAAGMAFFIPTFVVACWAAFGVERLERGEGRKMLAGALIGAGVLLLLGGSGVLARVAESLARNFDAARANAGPMALGSTLAALSAAGAAAIGLAASRGRLKGWALAAPLMLLVGADGFLNARRFFRWTSIADLYADDEVTRQLAATPLPYRALDLPEQGSYHGSFLMVKRIPNALGHHGNELNAYDQLLGGKNEWRNISNPRLWDLLALRNIVLPGEMQLAGFDVVARAASAASNPGTPSILYQAGAAPPYARVVTAAVKADEARIVPTLLDSRWDFNRIVLLPMDAPVNPPPLDTMPPAMAARASVAAWEPGAMTIRMDPVPEHDAYLVISENWYPDWRATVDGADARVLRGQKTLMTIPVPRGASEVQLRFSSPSYRQGKAITLMSLAGIGLWFVLPLARRRRQRG